MTKITIQKHMDQYYIYSIKDNNGQIVDVPYKTWFELECLRQACRDIFEPERIHGENDEIEFVNAWEPVRPDGGLLKIGRAIVEYATRTNTLANKINMIQLYRKLTAQGLKESKDCIEYAMQYPLDDYQE
jgi:hypothetical protein